MDRQITIRPMTPDDGQALVRLHRRAILLEGVRAYSPDMARSWAYGLEAEGYARSAAPLAMSLRKVKLGGSRLSAH